MADTAVRPVGGRKKWFQNPWVLAGGGGAVLALGAMAVRKKGGAAAPDPTVSGNLGQYQPASFNDAGTGAYNNLQNEFEALQQQLGAFGTTADIEALRKQFEALSPLSPAPLPSTHAKIPGKFNQKWNLRALAKYLTPVAKRNDPNAVEAELRSLIAVNPTWRGQSTVLGGHDFNMPIAKPN